MVPQPDASTLPRLRLGPVHLQVADLQRSLDFYQDCLGLTLLGREGSTVHLGVQGERGTGAEEEPAAPLLTLTERPGARPRPAHTTGLYHVALLLPARRELAIVLHRLLRRRWPVQGLSDHGVSEALYLADPDGNGLELYVDRPPAEWPRRAGRLAMTTRPLDLEGLWAQLPADPDRETTLPRGTRVGHIHLQVADLARAEAFYRGVLGLEVTVRNYPGALFLAAGGYHHHVGLNIWAGQGAPPPPVDAAGLRSFQLLVPAGAPLQALLARAQGQGVPVTQAPPGWWVRDPDGHAIAVVPE